MKIPLEWLKEYIHTSKGAEELAESFTSLGLMLDKPIEIYENGKYKTEILDLEHRMDRSDWLSITGCARDLAAYEQTKFKFPELDETKYENVAEEDRIKIEIKCKDKVNRFNTRIFKGVKVKESPEWLKNRLEAYGIPSINNIVDITNYVMVELGQPMHAQDIAKLEKPEIVIRNGRNGEHITTLLGETVEIDEDSFVLTQNDIPTVLGGIVGSIATGIDESTTDIVLDAGNYNQVNVRKTARRLKIQNETVLRYDKLLHPDLTEIALKRATKLILELASGKCFINDDWYEAKIDHKDLEITQERIKQISGMDFDIGFIEKTLNDLGYQITQKSHTGLSVKVPYFRTDVEIEDDLIADILRIYGYSNIPSSSLSLPTPKNITSKMLEFESKLREICIGLGLHEHITDPLVQYDQTNPKQIKLENAQSSVKNGLRTELFSGLAAVDNTYTKHNSECVGLFEIGKTYILRDTNVILENIREYRVTQILMRTSDDKDVKEESIKTRQILDTILRGLGMDKYWINKHSDTNFDIKYNEETIGCMKWDGICLYNQILINKVKPGTAIATEYKLMKSDDISLEIDSQTSLGKIEQKLLAYSDSIKDLEIIPQESETTSEKKKVLIRIKHTFTDFESEREKIKGTINA